MEAIQVHLELVVLLQVLRQLQVLAFVFQEALAMEAQLPVAFVAVILQPMAVVAAVGMVVVQTMVVIVAVAVQDLYIMQLQPLQ